MTSKLINICFSNDQADYSVSYFTDANFKNIKKEQIIGPFEDCTIAEVSGPDAGHNFEINPLKYYDDSNLSLWIVTADAP
ncbi:hypothetical protein JCM14076_28770 [Methylosoma difficile]